MLDAFVCYKNLLIVVLLTSCQSPNFGLCLGTLEHKFMKMGSQSSLRIRVAQLLINATDQYFPALSTFHFMSRPIHMIPLAIHHHRWNGCANVGQKVTILESIRSEFSKRCIQIIRRSYNGFQIKLHDFKPIVFLCYSEPILGDHGVKSSLHQVIIFGFVASSLCDLFQYSSASAESRFYYFYRRLFLCTLTAYSYNTSWYLSILASFASTSR